VRSPFNARQRRLSNLVRVANSIPPRRPSSRRMASLPPLTSHVTAYQLTVESANPWIASQSALRPDARRPICLFYFNTKTSAPWSIDFATPSAVLYFTSLCFRVFHDCSSSPPLRVRRRWTADRLSPSPLVRTITTPQRPPSRRHTQQTHYRRGANASVNILSIVGPMPIPTRIETFLNSPMCPSLATRSLP